MGKEVTFETAKLAKEKRYHEIANACYDINGKIHKGINAKNNDSDSVCVAPLQHDLQEWLRKLRKNADIWPIEVYFKPELTDKPRAYRWFLWRRGEEIDLGVFGHDDGLEHALFTALNLIEYYD